MGASFRGHHRVLSFIFAIGLAALPGSICGAAAREEIRTEAKVAQTVSSAVAMRRAVVTETCTLKKNDSTNNLTPNTSFLSSWYNHHTITLSKGFITIQDNGEDTCTGSKDVVSEQLISDFFDPAGFNTGEKVVFQHVDLQPVTHKIVMLVMTKNIATDEVVIYIAYSQGTSTLGPWSMTRISLLHHGFSEKTATHFCAGSDDDLIHNVVVGIDRDRLFIGFEDSNTTTFTGTGSVIDIALADLGDGGSLTLKCFENLSQFPTPPNVQSDTAALGKVLFLAFPPSDSDTIQLYRLTEQADVLNDTMTLAADIEIPFTGPPPPAQQPNGLYLDTGDQHFRVASVQVGQALYNVRTIGDPNGYAKVQVLKLVEAALPVFMLNISTRDDGLDYTFAPSLAVAGGKVFVTFTRTIPSSPKQGRASLMLARMAAKNPTNVAKDLLVRSPGEISKNAFGQPCNDSLQGCAFGPDTVTLVNPDDPSVVLSVGEIITKGTIGGAGSLYNWRVDEAVSTLP